MSDMLKDRTKRYHTSETAQTMTDVRHEVDRIDRLLVELLVERQRRAGLENIIPVLSTETDSRLPPGSVDLVLLVDVYHELSRPAEVMASVHRALRPGGRLVLVEYHGEDPRVAIKPLHRLCETQARAELAPQGFRWKETHRFLESQHVIVLEKAPRGS